MDVTPVLLSPSVRFHEDDHNCFTFCLKFINGVLAAEGHSPLSRDTFTLSFIVPRMRRVSQFMRLHQHLQSHQYYIVSHEKDEECRDCV